LRTASFVTANVEAYRGMCGWCTPSRAPEHDSTSTTDRSPSQIPSTCFPSRHEGSRANYAKTKHCCTHLCLLCRSTGTSPHSSRVRSGYFTRPLSLGCCVRLFGTPLGCQPNLRGCHCDRGVAVFGRFDRLAQMPLHTLIWRRRACYFASISVASLLLHTNGCPPGLFHLVMLIKRSPSQPTLLPDRATAHPPYPHLPLRLFLGFRH
jgi:hypothetical protein